MRRVPARPVAVLLAGILTVLTAMLIAGHGPWAGPPVLALSASHGLNLGDIPVLVLWAGGLAACVSLGRRGTP